MNINDLNARAFVRAMRRLAEVTGRFVVVCRSQGVNQFATFATYDAAEDHLCSLPAALFCEFKFIE